MRGGGAQPSGRQNLPVYANLQVRSKRWEDTQGEEIELFSQEIPVDAILFCFYLRVVDTLQERQRQTARQIRTSYDVFARQKEVGLDQKCSSARGNKTTLFVWDDSERHPFGVS